MRLLANFTILLSFLGLTTYGLLFIYSSTLVDSEAAPTFLSIPFSSELKKQLIFYFIGITSIIVLFRCAYIKLQRPALLIYILSLGLLLYTSFFGKIAGGARSWISLGFFNIQPSELMKVAWVVYLASYLRYRKSYRTLQGLVAPCLITGIPLLLILKQPDLGTAFLFVPTFFIILFLAGARKRHLFGLIMVMVSMAALLYVFGLKEYQKKRIEAYLNPGEYEKTYAYQLNHSILAIGEGHWLGKGLGQGQVNRFNLLPDSHTDFIFSIIAEELGFIGAIGLVICFLALVFSFFVIASFTREPFGRMVALGLGVLLGVQIFINISVAIGLLPTTGITLPFISAGGSSLISSCLMVGLVLSISRCHIPVLSREDFGL